MYIYIYIQIQTRGEHLQKNVVGGDYVPWPISKFKVIRVEKNMRNFPHLQLFLPSTAKSRPAAWFHHGLKPQVRLNFRRLCSATRWLQNAPILGGF